MPPSPEAPNSSTSSPPRLYVKSHRGLCQCAASPALAEVDGDGEAEAEQDEALAERLPTPNRYSALATPDFGQGGRWGSGADTEGVASGGMEGGADGGDGGTTGAGGAVAGLTETADVVCYLGVLRPSRSVVRMSP